MSRKAYILAALVLLVSASVASVGQAAGEVISESRHLMGTRVTVMIHTEDPQAARRAGEAALAEIDRIDRAFSFYRSDSVVGKINAGAGQKTVKVDDEAMELLGIGVDLAARTQGAFDITLAGAGTLYDFKAQDPAPPTDKARIAALARVGIAHLKLDQINRTARLDAPKTRIDLGGFVKGYGVDRACAVLKKHGLADFIVNAGGDMYVAGSKGDRPWAVGIQDPRGVRDVPLATVNVKDRAVVSSGDYERFFIRDGIRYHHILDPRTGRPAAGCRSVTVIADSAMWADATATAVFVLGPEKGLAFVQGKPGVECFIIDAQGRWIFSKGFQQAGRFTPRKRP